VLLGDAAHTAHFSIGSGTRLALDDAIALAKAFLAHPGDLRAAFATYEGERQPIVERFQDAASDSSRYFESVSRYVGFTPEQFAFNLLTRSGRITHLELTRRDPALVNRVDRWFAADGRLTVRPPSLVPLRLGTGTAVPNRVVLASPEGDDLAAAAGLGAGMVVSGPVAPSPEGRVTPETPGLWSDDQQARWRTWARAVHDAGALLGLRLTHAGRRGATRPRHRGADRPLPRGWPLLAASACPYRPGARTPRAVDGVAIEALGRAYAAAAARAAAADIDALILDMSDGYLLAGFLSPLANQRSDRYGGDLGGRARFPLAVMAAVRRAWPEDRALGVRLVADDLAPGGLTPDDGVTLAAWLKDAGADFVGVAAGHSVGGEAWAPSYRRLYGVGLADRIRNESGLPVIVSGHITRLDDVDTIVAAGRADLCVLDPRLYRPDPGGIR
jgi:anthraniloyl-CoA monooxygenase